MEQREAREKGLKHYCTGRPCKNGHTVKRFTSNGSCSACLTESYSKYHPLEKQRARSAAKRKANPEYAREASRRSREKNRDKFNADARRRHRENPQRARDKAARAKERDPTRQKRYDRISYLRNAEKRKENTRRWREANRERAKEYGREYGLAHPEKVRAKSHRRRARIIGNGGSYAEGDVKRIYRQQKGCCAYCRTELNGKYQIDHIIPLSAKGTNYPNNIQLLCSKGGGGCNQRKRDKDPIVFAQSIGMLL